MRQSRWQSTAGICCRSALRRALKKLPSLLSLAGLSGDKSPLRAWSTLLHSATRRGDQRRAHSTIAARRDRKRKQRVCPPRNIPTISTLPPLSGLLQCPIVRGMATPGQKRHLGAEQRRALQLLASSPFGAAEAIMVRAHGFNSRTLAGLVRAGLASTQHEPIKAGSRRIKAGRVRITAAGRRAIEG